MADDSRPDPVDMYAKNGKLYCRIGGVEFGLKHCAESIAATKAQAKAAGFDWDDEAPAKKKSIATPTAPAAPQDPTKMARRHSALAALATATEAAERFASTPQLREQFGVGPTARPGDAEFEQGEARYLRQLGRTT